MQPLRDITNQVSNQTSLVVQLPNGKRKKEFLGSPVLKRTHANFRPVKCSTLSLPKSIYARNQDIYNEESNLCDLLLKVLQEERVLIPAQISITSQLDKEYITIVKRSVVCNFSIQTIECAIQLFIQAITGNYQLKLQSVFKSPQLQLCAAMDTA